MELNNSLIGIVLLLSLSFLVLTVVKYDEKSIDCKFHFEYNSIPLFVFTLILLVLNIAGISKKNIYILSCILLPISIHILISYGKHYPGTITILKTNRLEHRFPENYVRFIKKMAIVGTVASVFGILLAIYLRLSNRKW